MEPAEKATLIALVRAPAAQASAEPTGAAEVDLLRLVPGLEGNGLLRGENRERRRHTDRRRPLFANFWHLVISQLPQSLVAELL